MQNTVISTNDAGPDPVPRKDNHCDPDYDDEITEENVRAMNETVDDGEFTGWEVVDGPAW